jgi:hypothetical protein
MRDSARFHPEICTSKMSLNIDAAPGLTINMAGGTSSHEKLLLNINMLYALVRR